MTSAAPALLARVDVSFGVGGVRGALVASPAPVSIPSLPFREELLVVGRFPQEPAAHVDQSVDGLVVQVEARRHVGEEVALVRGREIVKATSLTWVSSRRPRFVASLDQSAALSRRSSIVSKL